VPSDIPTDLAAALADRYDLQNIVGRGGMASVYRAFDRKHHREVAVKVLRPEIAASLGVERFIAEIQTVAGLTHPLILPLHDSGESGGYVYFVAPYIDGGSLRQRLLAQTRLGVAQAIEIAAPVADALVYAHRMGVVHRDIKPENILFSQGHPIVADFGIAKALNSATAPNLTRTGISLGTPGYMSPEQAAGLRELDTRTDVFSLAAVVYEMIVGETPQGWPSESEVRARRFAAASAEHRMWLSAAGSTIEGALVHALAIRPDDRPSTPAILIEELRGGSGERSRRRYDASEFDEIVRRASELEVTNPTTSGSMTLGRVEAIAAEAGIRPTLVRSAAASMTPSRALVPAKPNPVIGGPTRVMIERVIPGELPESEFGRVVDEIQRHFHQLGHVGQFGRSFTWSMSRGAPGRRDLDVSVRVDAGSTRIIVDEGLGQLIGGIFGGIGGGVGGGGMGPIIATLAAMHAGPEIAIAVPAYLLLVYGAARAIFRSASAARQRKLDAIADSLAASIESLIGERPT
jgi:serine/threonine protein kinase